MLAIWAGLVLLAVHVNQRAEEPVGLCTFKRVTGLPCPTCGSTRAVLRAGEGEVGAAFLSNPVVFTGLLALTVVLLLRFVVGRRLSFGLTPRQHKAAWLWLAAAVSPELDLRHPVRRVALGSLLLPTDYPKYPRRAGRGSPCVRCP